MTDIPISICLIHSMIFHVNKLSYSVEPFSSQTGPFNLFTLGKVVKAPNNRQFYLFDNSKKSKEPKCAFLLIVQHSM